MATVSPNHALMTPTEAEAKVAVESSRTLAAHVGAADKSLKLTVKNGKGHEELVLPPVALRLLLDLLTELGQGNSVALDTVQPELTTQQAADLLNVSRPFLVKILDEGVIPSRKIGTHRRVLREDVLAYRREVDRKRQEALDELSALDQELGLY